MKILGIESSCDETACSVVEDGKKILSNAVASQIDEHRLYGGVVPEIASRRHAENITAVAKKALIDADVSLKDIDAVAVTYAPGLIGALLVGISFAKGLCLANNLPLVPVHHIAGHMSANYLTHPDLKPPYLCLVVSGGHSHIIEVLDYTKFHLIGRTRDDAVGECFDKVARTVGFEYPGGKHIDATAQLGDPNAYRLPKPKVNGSEFDFSFSGLKTAVINIVHNAQQKGEDINTNNIAASFQKTVTDILVEKTELAAKTFGYNKIAVAGGVSANSSVRRGLENMCSENGFEFFAPKPELCGDNGAMIACQGYYDFISGKTADLSLNGIATLPIDKISI